jgi:hypothetical protein
LKSNKKTCFFASKSLEKFRKSLESLESLEKRSEKVRKKFGKSSEKVQKFRKLGISELSETYEKMTFNSKFENHEKLVPTRKPTQKFSKKFGMQGLNTQLLLVACQNIGDSDKFVYKMIFLYSLQRAKLQTTVDIFQCVKAPCYLTRIRSTFLIVS